TRGDSRVRIATHFGHKQPAVFIKGDGHGIYHVRLAGHELDTKSFGNVERAQFFLRRERAGGRCAGSAISRGAANKNERDGHEHERPAGTKADPSTPHKSSFPGDHAINSRTTRPCTSVSRKSRPA